MSDDANNSHFADGGTIGSGAARTARGSGGACTFNISANDSHFPDGSTIGSGVAYGRGIAS